MLPDQYVNEAMRSLKPGQTFEYNLNHALYGLMSETGEIAHSIKKFVIYEQRFDKENIQEEIGDVMWYVAVLCHATGISLEVAMRENIEKLKLRYPDKFSPEAAMARADKQNGLDQLAE